MKKKGEFEIINLHRDMMVQMLMTPTLPVIQKIQLQKGVERSAIDKMQPSMKKTINEPKCKDDS